LAIESLWLNGFWVCCCLFPGLAFSTEKRPGTAAAPILKNTISGLIPGRQGHNPMQAALRLAV
jgi:hypothetical protein